MSLLFKIIMKIKNTIILSILSISLSVIMLCSAIGFFVLPFITYGDEIKNIFFIIWGICVVEVLIEMIIIAKHEVKTKKKEIEEYQKDKVVYWYLRISSILSFVLTFLLVFLKRNYQFPINVYGIIFVFICLVVIVAAISNLLSMYKNNYKQMVQDGALLCLCLFSLLCIAAGIMSYKEDNLATKILIAFGATVLLIIGIRYVFKFLVSIEKINTVSSSIILFIFIGILGGIILRYVITDCQLQEILTTIFAAIIGGAITLGGVAWTIKSEAKNRQDDFDKREQERKEEERKKAIPYLRVSESKNEYKSSFVVDIQVKQKKNGISQGTMYLFTINESIFIFKGAIIDGKLYEVGERLLSKENQIQFIYNKYEVENVEILGCDALGNYYKYRYLDKYLDMPKELTKEETEALYKND